MEPSEQEQGISRLIGTGTGPYYISGQIDKFMDRWFGEGEWNAADFDHENPQTLRAAYREAAKGDGAIPFTDTQLGYWLLEVGR